MRCRIPRVSRSTSPSTITRKAVSQKGMKDESPHQAVVCCAFIGVALSLPTKVRASGTEWTCNWADYSQCYDALQQWMGQCTYGCGTGGSGTTTCALVNYGDCWENPDGTGYCFSTYYEDCSVSNSCIANCIEEYNEQYNTCLNDNCYQ